MAGVLHDEDKTEYWSDNANNVDDIASNPAGFSLVPAVFRSAQKVGDKCCPSVMKWSP